MARITTATILKDKSLSAGDSSTSGSIDLRYCSTQQNFALHHSITAGTATTCGTTVFSYVCSPSQDGTYVSPSASGTFATSGPAIAGKVTAFTPVLTPFMKIVTAQTGAGTAGANSKVTANLFVQ
jgi:hypothetical protein